MNYEIAMKWADALESDKYQQGRHYLKDDNSRYCCLGVLCDISEQGEWTLIYLNNYYSYISENDYEYLPEKVMTWAEMKTADGGLENQFNTLTLLNDNGTTFSDIAKIIRKNWEKL